jgi:DNA-binding MarR family transcriptional regulator/N-acetylglutamate synthase-like GNAT family acetyltransferase
MMERNILNELGELAIGSRLKRLSDYIMREGKVLYSVHNIDFEPKWFPVFYTIASQSSTNVMKIAETLNVTHAAVSQTVKDLVRNDIISTVNHESDGRKKSLELSKKGDQLLHQMEPIWQDIATALNDLFRSNQNHLITAIQEVESKFMESGFTERIKAVTNQRLLEEVEIVEYLPKYAEAFKILNIEWLEKYFYVEEYDKEVLSNPQKHILDKGGAIYFALLAGEVVGTCALMQPHPGAYELAKMAVTHKAQGKQAGKKLGLRIIEKARKMKLKMIFLESNKTLTPALALYEKLGFKYMHKDASTSAYERANVYMELIL